VEQLHPVDAGRLDHQVPAFAVAQVDREAHPERGGIDVVLLAAAPNGPGQRRAGGVDFVDGAAAAGLDPGLGPVHSDTAGLPASMTIMGPGAPARPLQRRSSRRGGGGSGAPAA
jgi:hypothetical protein